MATNKIYAYLGKNTASIDIQVAESGYLHVDFEGGSIFNINGYTPAKTKVISDPTIQAIIESDYRFGHEIVLWSCTKEEGEPEISETVYEDPESFSEVCEILKTKHDVKATQLRSPEGVRKVAASLNVKFPNWK